MAPTEVPPTSTANEEIANTGDRERVFEQVLSAFQRGHDLSEQGRWLEAIEALQTAQHLEETDSRVLQRLLGHAYWKDGQPRQAIEHFTRAIDVEDSARDRMNRARAYSEIERCDLAVEDMQKALGMESRSGKVPHTDAETHAVMAQCHSDPTRKIEHWQEYIRAAETHGYGAEQVSHAYVEMAWTHQYAGDTGEAERMLNEAVAIADSAFTRAQRAMLHFRQDNCELATKDSLAALSKPPVIATGFHTSGEASRLLAQCHTKSENFEAALQHAEMAHELMRDHRYSEEDVERIADLEHRLQQVVRRW